MGGLLTLKRYHYQESFLNMRKTLCGKSFDKKSVCWEKLLMNDLKKIKNVIKF